MRPNVKVEPALLASAFEQSPAANLLLDSRGYVLSANAAALTHLGRTSSADIDNQPIWDLAAHTFGREAAAWWRTAVDGAAAGRVEVRDIGSDAITEWTVRPVRNREGNVVAVAAEGRDVTAVRRADLEARLLMRLALAIGHTDSLELAVSAGLRTVCEATGWVMGEAWLLERATDPPRLSRAGLWATRDARLDRFASQGVGLGFERGEGLPGTAWARGEVVWVPQVSNAEEFTRAPVAAAAGIKSAVAIPVLASDEIVGVLSFYMTAAAVDPPMAHVTIAAAAQLGPLILQKQTEEAHRVTEAKLGGIVSIALDAIISIDHERRITLFNWGAERIFGYAADEILGQSLDVLLPANLRGRHAAHIAHFAASAQTARRMGERSPIVGLRQNGETFPAEASISRFRAGDQWTFTVILRDITDRHRTEEGLRFLAETGELLTDILRDPTVLEGVARRAVPTLGDVCIIDLADDGQIITAAVAASDTAVADAVRSARDAAPVRWDADDPVADALRRRETQLLPNHPRSALGLGSLLVVPLVTHDRILGTMTFAMGRSGRRHDASYRTLAEELAIRVALAVDGATLYRRSRQAVAARDEVLAVVSHDLRNPLSAINMCVGALREQPPPQAETAAELLGTVQESAGLMSRIIQDLLDVASIDAGRLSIERRPQPLGPVVTQAIAMFESIAVERQLTLTVGQAAAGTLPDVTIDADRILQVLANLLHNACKFTGSGGSVRVESAALPGHVQVAVLDTGPGIASEDLPRVFDRFWHDRHSSKIRSSGLGLAIARGIVEAHGGRMWVESTQGQGSMFVFTLPT